jgi:hypothetical protein
MKRWCDILLPFKRTRQQRKVHIWCFKCALRCSMNAWKMPFVTGIRTSGQNPLKTRSSRRLKLGTWIFMLSLFSQHLSVEIGLE